MQVFLLGVLATKVVQVGVVKDSRQLVPENALALQGGEDACDGNGDTCRNGGNPVKEGLDGRADKERYKVDPDGKGLEYASLPLAYKVENQAVDKETVVDCQVEPVTESALVDVAVGNIENEGNEVV